jgi:enoyl-CoA hydratase/carnithine racemase
MSYDTILTSVEDRVGIIELNRPEALNALSDRLLS